MVVDVFTAGRLGGQPRRAPEHRRQHVHTPPAAPPFHARLGLVIKQTTWVQTYSPRVRNSSTVLLSLRSPHSHCQEENVSLETGSAVVSPVASQGATSLRRLHYQVPERPDPPSLNCPAQAAAVHVDERTQLRKNTCTSIPFSTVAWGCDPAPQFPSARIPGNIPISVRRLVRKERQAAHRCTLVIRNQFVKNATRQPLREGSVCLLVPQGIQRDSRESAKESTAHAAFCISYACSNRGRRRKQKPTPRNRKTP